MQLKTDYTTAIARKYPEQVAIAIAKDPQARAIMDRMAQTYATCRSYRDTGLVETTFLPDSRLKRTPFMTAFQRPGRFRFEFKTHFPHSPKWHYHVIHFDSSGTRVWESLSPGLQEHDSLDMAIAGATGISSGSAHTIPSLLFDIPESNRLTNLKALKLLPDAELERIACYRIEGTTGREKPETLWIDKSTYLLMRIEESRDLSTCKVHEVTTYLVEIDIDIPPDELEFHESGRL